MTTPNSNQTEQKAYYEGPPVNYNDYYRPEALHYHRHGPGLFGLTVEEIKAINECRTEAMWGYGLPASAALGIATHLAVKNGYLTPNPKYGSSLKVLVAVLFGNILGRAMYNYFGGCQDKLAKLENSHIGDTARKLNEAGLRLPPHLIVAGSEPNPFMNGPWGWWYDNRNCGYGAGYRYFPTDQHTDWKPQQKSDSNVKSM